MSSRRNQCNTGGGSRSSSSNSSSSSSSNSRRGSTPCRRYSSLSIMSRQPILVVLLAVLISWSSVHQEPHQSSRFLQIQLQLATAQSVSEPFSSGGGGGGVPEDEAATASDAPGSGGGNTVDEATDAPSNGGGNSGGGGGKGNKGKGKKLSFGKCFKLVSKNCKCKSKRGRKQARRCLQRITKKRCKFSKGDKRRIKSRYNRSCEKNEGKKPFKN